MPTALGIVASSFVSAGACTDVLAEPFNNLSAWNVGGSNSTIVAGRTGTALRNVGSAATVWARYTIPAVNESDTITIGFAYKTSHTAGPRLIAQFKSDAGATNHLLLQALSDGALEVKAVGTGAVLVSSGAGIISATNTWYYIELQMKLHDTAGAVALRVDGTPRGSVTNVDTRTAGTKAVFDLVELSGPGAGITSTFDDLYLSTGAGCGFKGDHAIVAGTDVLLEPFNHTGSWT